MNQDPNVGSVERVVEALGVLVDEMVLVGGCAVGLLMTDNGRPPIRQTIDVDLVTEVTPLSSYYQLHDRLRALGFKEHPDVICRWSRDELLIDVMPTDEKILSFTNRWYQLAAKTSTQYVLPSGKSIRLIAPPVFLATKFEAFQSRGEGNFSHHDIEDIVNLVDGRVELVAETRNADEKLRTYLMQEFDDLLAERVFVDRLAWHFGPDEVDQARVSLVLERMRRLAGL